jgi:hypothetical protein
VTFPILDWHLNRNYKPADARQHLGRIPLLINPDSPDPIYRQIEDNYPAGWQPVAGLEREKWTLTFDDYLIYPGLPPLAPAAMAQHAGERVLVYPAGWVVVVNDLNGEFTVARIEP